MDIVYLGFCKAFNTVPHNILLSEELAGWLHPEGSGQQLDVQMEISDKWCRSGVCTGTSTV